MKYSSHLIAATAAVIMLLLLSGCEKAATPQQGVQQQGIVSEAEAPDSQPQAAENVSDGLDEALAELDTLEGLEE